MSTTLFKRIQKNPFNVWLLIILLLTLSSLETSQASTEEGNPEKTAATEITFTGAGPEETRTFSVEDGWKIEWETESPPFKLSAHGTAQRPYIGSTNEREKILQWFESVQPLVLANTFDTNGTAYHPLGGTFYLKIVADGPWRIHLQTIPDTKDYLDVPYTGAP